MRVQEASGAKRFGISWQLRAREILITSVARREPEQEKEKSMTTKVIVNLPDETIDNWRYIANCEGTTLTEALTRAVARQSFLDGEVRQR